MRSKIAYLATTVVAASLTLAAGASAASAGITPTPGNTGPGSCQVSAVSFSRADHVVKRARHRATTAAAAAAYKAAHDSQAALLRKLAAANVKHDARKRALIRKGLLKLKAPSERKTGCGSRPGLVSPDATTPYQYQYGQVTDSFCGPATIEEISASVPGPSVIGLDQWGIAAYMDGNGGNTINANGTNADQEVNGLNYFVGVPDYGWNFYGFVGMSFDPTSGDRSGFEANLASDVSSNSPVAGDAWEVPGGPHLVGQPVNEEIFHWFAIYGTSGSSAYYADSANTIWSSVPAFSWYDTYTLETILGGRGYIW